MRPPSGKRMYDNTLSQTFKNLHQSSKRLEYASTLGISWDDSIQDRIDFPIKYINEKSDTIILASLPKP